MRMGAHKADPQPGGKDACGRPSRGLSEGGGEPGPPPQVVLNAICLPSVQILSIA